MEIQQIITKVAEIISIVATKNVSKAMATIQIIWNRHISRVWTLVPSTHTIHQWHYLGRHKREYDKTDIAKNTIRNQNDRTGNDISQPNHQWTKH